MPATMVQITVRSGDQVGDLEVPVTTTVREIAQALGWPAPAAAQLDTGLFHERLQPDDPLLVCPVSDGAELTLLATAHAAGPEGRLRSASPAGRPGRRAAPGRNLTLYL